MMRATTTTPAGQETQAGTLRGLPAHPDGARIWARAFARGLRSDPLVAVAAWAARHRMIAAGSSPFPGRWSNAVAPYLTEPMDRLSTHDPAERVVIVKAAQLGFSELVINWFGYTAHLSPAPMLVVRPTRESCRDWADEKLDPTIEATHALKTRVADIVARSGRGSTTTRKKFPGGWMRMVGANASSSLREKSVARLVCEELDEWPIDLNAQGSPLEMACARLSAYRASGQAKELLISTPARTDSSAIWAEWLDSDRRRYLLPCPHCGARIELLWEHLHWSPSPPHRALYHCQDCGAGIAHHEKRAMLAAGQWVAQAPGEGRAPGYHINGLYSPFMTWDQLVAEAVKAAGDPAKEQAFRNLRLGLPWDGVGEAPDHERLLVRREDWRKGFIPAGGVLLTAGVDVGESYLQYEIVAWGPGKSSWSVDFGLIEGDTSGEDVWRDLDRLIAAPLKDAHGNLRQVELWAIDTGFRTTKVYDYGRGRPAVMLVDGRAGTKAPPLGSAVKVGVSKSGRRIKGRGAVTLWPVGTHALKEELYAFLHLDGVREGAAFDPPGYCHFSADHDAEFFRQLTAERLIRSEDKGRVRLHWQRTGRNHFLDCRVYARAAAERLGLSRLTMDQWRSLMQTRCQPVPVSDLLAFALSRPVSETIKPAAPPPAARPAPAARGGEGRGGKFNDPFCLL